MSSEGREKEDGTVKNVSQQAHIRRGSIAHKHVHYRPLMVQRDPSQSREPHRASTKSQLKVGFPAKGNEQWMNEAWGRRAARHALPSLAHAAAWSCLSVAPRHPR